MSFTVAIVGRPNVGKSTLFNRLTGKRSALVDDTPGVTRDRREGSARIADMEFAIVDTAGLEEAESGSLQARMTAQTHEAINDADVALLVVDARAGITPMDKHFAQLIRKTHKPVVLVVNKAEGKAAGDTIGDAYKLGFGEPVAMSAEHGEGLADLYQALMKFDKSEEPDDAEPEAEVDVVANRLNAPLQIAIIGRPNAGKSTLINRILGEDRMLTGPEAGITRDAIAVDYQFGDKKIKLYDTAGLRKKSGVVEKLEKLAVADTLEAVQFAHVVVLVIDANQPLEKQDNTIAALVEQEGRAMVLAVNKWDTVPDQPAYMKAIEERLVKVLPQMKGLFVVPISAQNGFGIEKLIKECFRAYQQWNREFSTGELNRWLESALMQYTPPLVKGRRIKIRYMTQKCARPPTFILFANTSDIPESYLRYLSNSMREAFNLPGVPLRIRIRKNKNPYADAPE